jgi:hypothetical protein
MSFKSILAALTIFTATSPAFSAMAHVETLSYNGAPLTGGPFAGSQIEVTLTATEALPFNGIISFTNAINGEYVPTSFVIADTDGLSLSKTTATNYSASFNFVNGTLADWFIDANTGPSAALLTVNDSGVFSFFGEVYDSASVNGQESVSAGFPNSPASGTWTVTAGVPEPTAWALMMLGLAGVGATLRRRRPQALSQAL